MKQRLLSGLLAVVLLLGLAPAALATAPSEAEAAQVLAALDIMVGDQNGDLALDRTLTRAEFTKLAVAASTSRDAVGDTVAVKPYPDVPQNHWAAPYIKAAVDLGLVEGDLRGYFNPDRTITLAEGVTVVLRLLGYEDSEFTGVWPSGQMAQYRALKLNQGISLGQNDPMTRRDALYLFYNLLLTKNKSGTYYLNVLEPTLNLVNSAGELDRVALINSAMEGPLVVAAGWQSKLTFTPSTATVYRNGSLSSLDKIQNQDVLYWSDSMRTVWAYSDKITGAYESATPSASNPTSVTVAGKTYAIETTEAAFYLSDLGQHQVGDTVSLLLGRDGGVAAVSAAEESDGILYGVITAVDITPYDDGKGESYTSRTITVYATNGGSYRYQTTDRNLDVGQLVRVEPGKDGGTITRLSDTRLNAQFNSDATKLGNYPVADDVEIIDTYGTCTPIQVYPERLAGVALKDDMVRCYVLNGKGEISRLILNDATGDIHQYGVITRSEENQDTLPDGTTMSSSSYTYDVGGQRMTYSLPDKVLHLNVGPCQVVKSSDNTVEDLNNLTEVKLSGVSGNVAVGTDNREYTLSEDVAVYVLSNNDYQLSTLSRVTGGEYTLTGWYDKTSANGGRIRVIIAR